MQQSQAAKDKGRVGIEEQEIRFRPSPNFKNMKKFLKLKSKIDFTDNANHSPPQGAEQSPTNASPEPVTSLEEQRALLEKAQPAQPPLPLEPPPASPIDFSLPQKQEIEDHEYNQGGSNSPTINPQSEQTYETPQTEKKVRRTICRDFIRGTCSRAPGACRYAHERDLSQLPGVYTFCKNFQNTVCTYPFCKYVHATIFEEQKFYRTGVLPPHALAHRKPPTMVPVPPAPPPPPPPPPPPHPKPTEEPAPASIPPPPPLEVPIFAQPPPSVVPTVPVVPSVDKPVITCVPTANLTPRPIEDLIIPPAPRDDHKAKKCKSCATMDFRLQFNKDKTENMKQSTMELKNKVALLTKKTHMLYTVLLSLMKPQATKRPEATNGLSMSTLLNIIGDSEMNLLSNLLNEPEPSLVPETRES